MLNIFVNCFLLLSICMIWINCVQIDELEKFRTYDSFVELKGGDYLMGINDREGVNFEYPQRKAIVRPFRMSLYPVTIASFKKYKNDKFKYRTEAEKTGYSWVLENLLDEYSHINNETKFNDQDSKDAMEMKMVSVYESRWNRPAGGHSTVSEILTHPVTHVSYNDAFAYCTWRGMRLPTEIEWEYAARGGLKEKLYPWGDYWEIGRTNLWQGKFPYENQVRDGHYGISPVDAFEPQNEYNMYDVLGNVWEWTSTVYRELHNPKDKGDRRVLKGGSFLDTRDGENHADKMKIRVSTRVGRKPGYTAQNVGFRCAQSIEEDERVRFENRENFRVVKLRPPVFHRKTNNDEL